MEQEKTGLLFKNITMALVQKHGLRRRWFRVVMAGEKSGLQQAGGCENAEWTGWSRRAACGKTDSVQVGYSAAVWFTLLVLVHLLPKVVLKEKQIIWVCFFFFFSDMQERVEMTKPLNLGREIL